MASLLRSLEISLDLLGRAVISWLIFTHSLLTQNIVLREGLGSQNCILAELVMKWDEMIHLVEVSIAIKHAQRVMSVTLCFVTTYIIFVDYIFEAIVSEVIAVVHLMLLLVLVDLLLVVNQIFDFPLGKLRGRMCSVRGLHLFSSTHVQ